MIGSALFGHGDFTMLRAALVREVGLAGAMVLSRIHFRTNEQFRSAYQQDEYWWWRAPASAIAEETGMSEGQVRRTLDSLRDAGHVVAVQHELGGVRDRSYSYRVALVEEEAHVSDSADGTGEDAAPHVSDSADAHVSDSADAHVSDSADVLSIKTLKKDLREEEPPSAAAPGVEVGLLPPASFADFWAVWPRKTDKQDARKAWDAAVRRAPAHLIVEGAARLANDPNLPPKTFIKHPATWLNGSCWENEEPLPERFPDEKPGRFESGVRAMASPHPGLRDVFAGLGSKPRS